MKYSRLPGSRTGLGRRNTLWLGDDHLLAVDSTGYTEEYTRFYFKDIRAVITRRTSRGRIWNGILGSMLAIDAFVLIVSAKAGNNAAIASFAIVATLIIPLLIYNVVLGTSCRCHLLMPLGIHDLPSLRRVKRVRGVMERLRPRIKDLQGTVRQEEITAQGHAHLPDLVQVCPAAAAVRPNKTENVASDYGGAAHILSFALLIADAVMGVINLTFHTASVMIVAGILTITLVASLITAIVKQHTGRVPLLTRRLVWISLALLGTSTMLVAILGPAIQVMNTPAGQVPNADMTRYFDVLASNPVFAGFIYAYGVIALVVGLAGLLSMVRGLTKRPAAEGNATATGNPESVS